MQTAKKITVTTDYINTKVKEMAMSFCLELFNDIRKI